MAHQLPNALLCLLGSIVWGDIGALTLYKDKQGKVVTFSKTWPKKPPSPGQTVLRNKMRAAAAAWRVLGAEKRQQWELATLRASLCMCGYALFVHHQFEHDDEAIQAIQRQTRTSLIPP